MSQKYQHRNFKQAITDYIRGVGELPENLTPAEVQTVQALREARMGAEVRLVQPHEQFAAEPAPQVPLSFISARSAEQLSEMSPSQREAHYRKKQAVMAYMTGATDIPPNTTEESLAILNRVRDIRNRVIGADNKS